MILKYFQNQVKLLFFCLLFTMLFPSEQAQAAVLKVHYHDTTYSYTGTQAGAVIDGITIDLGNCPGLILDDTALLPLEDVFQAALGAETSYNSESGEIILSKFNNEIIMYIDSKIFYINGEKQELSTAPLSVKYTETAETRILIPARLAAEGLGYTYVWNSSKKRAEITSPFRLYYDETWFDYTDIQGKVAVNGTNISLGKMPAVKIDNSIMVPSKKVFSSEKMETDYSYNESTQQVVISGSGIELIFTMGNTEVLVNKEKKELPSAPRIVLNGSNNVTYIMVPIQFIAEQLGYYYLWNSSTKTVEIYTSESSMIAENEYYFSAESSLDFSEYIKTLSTVEDNYHLEGSGEENATITEIIYEEVLNSDRERYIITANQPFGEMDASFDNNTKQISIYCKNSSATDMTYSFDKPMIQSAIVSYDNITKESLILFQTSLDKVGYQVSLSEDQCSIYVDIFDNCLTSITAQKYANQDILTFNTVLEPQNSYSFDGQILTITFPHTKKAIAEEILEAKNSQFIKEIALTEKEDQSLLAVITYSGNFYTQISGSKFQIIFYQLSDNNTENNFDIYIPLPSDIKYNNLTDKDPYADKKFKILMPGDYTSFYDKNTIVSNNKVIKNIKIALNTAGTKTVITIQTTKIQGYQMCDAAGALGLFLGTPKKMYKNIVLLDAGHGGKDSGAVNGSYQEKTFNLSILYKKAKQYFNKSETIKAYWTRATDVFIDLYERPKISSKAKADMFVSLHMNSASSSSAKGLEVYYSKSNTSKSSSGLTSKLMASYFQESLISKIGCSDRGYKSAEYVVLKYNTVPSVLIELGFISNSTDLARLKNSSQQTKAAKAIYDTLEELFEKYPTGR